MLNFLIMAKRGQIHIIFTKGRLKVGVANHAEFSKKWPKEADFCEWFCQFSSFAS
jgi:hypothetical protein